MMRDSQLLRLPALLLLSLFLGTATVQAVFYRNIPFRYKPSPRAENNPGIIPNNLGGQLLMEQIDKEVARVSEEEAEQNGDQQLLQAPRRIIRLIPVRESHGLGDNGPGRMLTLSQAAGRESPAASLNSHLMALRPDYAFTNVADFLRNFFDSRIERSRKSAEQKAFFQ